MKIAPKVPKIKNVFHEFAVNVIIFHSLLHAASMKMEAASTIASV